ncbi:MAG TPA: phosphoglucosamine mutase [Thermoplasmata archaeon]|nr:phosphoglucosamine mutase [Thermoplasmata archaeon]
MGELSLFGTDGIRGVVGELYTPQFVADIGSAFATFLGGRGDVLIGWDFRFTSPGIVHLLAGTLQMHGLDPVELGPMPTPCLQFNVREWGARAGLMVTASHNPVEFNGIKFCAAKGLEQPPEVEREIERIYRSREFAPVVWNRSGAIRTDELGLARYCKSIAAHVDRPSIQARAPRVVLDCGNGTSLVSSPPLFRELGASLVTLNANPDGAFPGRPSEPSDENLTDLKKTVPQVGASLGVAHDGDSDRVSFVDETGRYIPGEVTLALFARYMLARHPGATIVTSVTSSSCVADVVAADGGRLVVTRSGSLPVAIGVEQENGIFGGEENGHYYWPEHQNAPDGPMSSAVMLELLAHSDRPLSAWIAELPKYTVVKLKVPTPHDLKALVVESARRELGADAERLVTIDGVKAFFSDGWILVRPSGTEPLVRVFAEARTDALARRLGSRGTELVRSVLEESGRAPEAAKAKTSA